MTGKGSTETPLSCLLAEAILDSTSIWSPWGKAPWKITQLYARNLRSRYLSWFILASVKMLACAKLPTAIPKWDNRMRLLPWKAPSTHWVLHLDPKDQSEVPSRWKKDFQLAIKLCLSGLLWWVPYNKTKGENLRKGQSYKTWGLQQGSWNHDNPSGQKLWVKMNLKRGHTGTWVSIVKMWFTEPWGPHIFLLLCLLSSESNGN